MTIPLPPVPGPEITPRALLVPPWQSWFSQLYVYLTATASGGGGIVPASRRINTTAPLTGGGTIANDLTLALAANGITNAFLAQMSANTLKGNNTAGLANVADLTAAQVKTLLAYAFADISGTLPNSQLATMPANTVKGNNTGGVASPIDLTQAQLTALINVFTTLLSGAVPASGGGTANFLRADATWQAPPGTAVGANPTGTVGLSAVNGALTTFLRSDGAPALSQGIVPTWTGAHVFAASSGVPVTINAAASGQALSLPAGTATKYPTLINSGVNLTTPVAGAVEFDGSTPYFTPFATCRGVSMTEFMQIISGAYTLTSQTGAQKLLNATATGAITLPIGVYEFECAFSLTAMSASAGAFGFALGGSSTHTDAWWAVADKPAALATGVATATTTYNTAANVAISPSTTNTVGWAQVRGIIRVTVAGTIIPQVSLGVAAAAVVGANSFFRILPVGPSGFTTVGQWT